MLSPLLGTISNLRKNSIDLFCKTHNIDMEKKKIFNESRHKIFIRQYSC